MCPPEVQVHVFLMVTGLVLFRGLIFKFRALLFWGSVRIPEAGLEDGYVGLGDPKS